MLLAQLTRPENKSDTSPFIKNILPSFMEEICSLGNMGVAGLFALIDHAGPSIPDSGKQYATDHPQSYG